MVVGLLQLLEEDFCQQHTTSLKMLNDSSDVFIASSPHSANTSWNGTDGRTFSNVGSDPSLQSLAPQRSVGTQTTFDVETFLPLEGLLESNSLLFDNSRASGSAIAIAPSIQSAFRTEIGSHVMWNPIFDEGDMARVPYDLNGDIGEWGEYRDSSTGDNGY
jgi:hypothetical protein